MRCGEIEVQMTIRVDPCGIRLFHRRNRLHVAPGADQLATNARHRPVSLSEKASLLAGKETSSSSFPGKRQVGKFRLVVHGGLGTSDKS